MISVALYEGEGVSSRSFQHLYTTLIENLPPSVSIVRATPAYFLTPNWEAETSLIVFPGGRDLPYHQQLKGEANTRIRRFVEQGGRFLGVCAGAYYGSSFIEFEKGAELEICESRELKFFPGKAVGPAYGNGFFSYTGEQGARAASISWEKGVCDLYYNGGCYFVQADSYPSVKVIGRYHDLTSTPAAIIYCAVGKGGALLMGVHAEYGAPLLRAQEVSLQSAPGGQENLRKALWKHLFNQIFI